MLIVLVGATCFAGGWVAGRGGAFVSGLIAAVNVKKEVERNLDQAMQSLNGVKERAEELATEKLNLERRVQELIGKKAATPKPAAKPKPVAEPKPKPKPPDIKSCLFLWGCK